MIHLKSIGISADLRLPEEFPFTLSHVRKFRTIELNSPVTFFIGENGSGKSTILESIAAGIGHVAVGGSSVESDPTLVNARKLGRKMFFSWSKRTNRGFFLRSEDFFNFARKTTELTKEMEEMESQFASSMKGYGKMLATGLARGQKNALIDKYDGDLDSRSHGEAFLALFQSRIVPNGLYLLDEPETPLSPHRQFAFLSILLEMTKTKNAQFIIATHSPILMAMPGAEIYNFDVVPLEKIEFNDIEHVTFTRDFLNNPEIFMRHLID